MKHNIRGYIIVISFGILLFSCENEEVINEEAIPEFEIAGITLNCTDGILVFKSQEDMLIVTEHMNSTDITTQLELFYNKGFRSQDVILHDISLAEDEFDAKYYEGVDKTISVQDLISLGYGIEHSEQFNYYLNQGLIEILCEEDGSESYHPTVVNPSLMCVLSEEGFVVVDDFLYQYSSDYIRFTPFSNMDQLEEFRNTNGASSAGIISTIRMQSNLKGYITHIDNKVTKTKGSHLRVSCRYALWDGDNDGQYVTPAWGCYVNHFLELKAEEKRWGKWKTRNNYNPLCGVEGSWETCIDFGGTYPDCTWSQTGAGVKYSPIDEDPFSFGCTNYYKTNLSPVGMIHLSGHEFNGIVDGYWSFSVSAANIGDPDNSGTI